MTSADRPVLRFLDETHLTIGDVELRFGFPFPHDRDPDEVVVMKTRPMIEPYVEVIKALEPRNIVELGIMRGGSVALIGLLAQPARHVAFELSATPVAELQTHLERTGLTERTSLHYGVNQSDGDRIAAIATDEFGDEAIDLVVDDASHRFEPTVASFNVLFPRLRPGGRFIIEDWASEHLFTKAMAQHLIDAVGEDREKNLATLEGMLRGGIDEADAERIGQAFRADPTVETLTRCHTERAALTNTIPLSRMVLELAVTVAESVDVVESVSFNADWIEIVRGPASVDTATFALERLWLDMYGVLG